MEQKRQIWEQQIEEPDLWYKRFLQFFLLESEFDPNVNSAYIRFACSEAKNRRERSSFDAWARKGAPKEWIEKAKQYKWQERFNAYKAHQKQKLIEEVKSKNLFITQEKIEASEAEILRNKILDQQFISNWGDPNYKYDRTADAVNVARFSELISKNTEKALNNLIVATGIKKMVEQQKELLKNKNKYLPPPPIS
jgi:hypothetical protein